MAMATELLLPSILPLPAQSNKTKTPNKASLIKLLDTKCPHSLHHLKQTHAQLAKLCLTEDSYIAGALVKHYSNPDFDTFHTALKVFHHVPRPHVFLFNSVIRGCLDNGADMEAVEFYVRMVLHGSVPNKYTFPPLMNACASAGAVEEGKQMHAHVVKLGFGGYHYIVSAGIRMYAACGMVAVSRTLLSVHEKPDPVCWNATIDGCMKNGEVTAAKELFESMPLKNIATWNTMISGYAANGAIKSSRALFDEMPKRDEVSWSAMIDGYVQGGHSAEALAVFRSMMEEGISPRKFVLPSVLTACADTGALEQGRWIHAYSRRNSIRLDSVLGTSLIDMYSKCGQLDLALDVFNKITNRKVFTWNAMIGGFALHGEAEQAIEIFSRMKRDNVSPNAITFVNLLNACAHAGLVEEGFEYFNKMEEEFCVLPEIEHYGCMIDLLGRTGRFSEAEKMIASMPMKPNAAVWGALLGACRIHRNIELGEKIGSLLIEMESENSGRYTLLSNIYARAGRWDDVSKIRKMMKERGIRTVPGMSLIEVDGILHQFTMADCSHPRAEEISKMLAEILEKIKLNGYMKNTNEVLFDICEEEKESALSYHSEKLAIAFGLLNTTAGTAVRIVKNLRVCKDCHSAMKLISQVYNREIIVRDLARYHHIKDGKCSCNDFW